MKRFLSLSLALMLCFGLLAGCTNTDGANGGIINDSSADMKDPANENLLDRGEDAVEDMVDDMDPNRDKNTNQNTTTTPSDGTNATTNNNTAR